jgi:hypothetical protein
MLRKMLLKGLQPALLGLAFGQVGRGAVAHLMGSMLYQE